MKQELTQEYLKEILDYDPETGFFFWKKTTSSQIKNGDIAGCLDKDDYIQIHINKKNYPAHHLVYLYLFGFFPISFIDHENGNRLDNTIINLRHSTFSENGINSSLSKNNTTGLKSVNFNKKSKRWKSQINYQKKSIYLGSFDTKEEAGLAYNKKALELFGEFAWLNNICQGPVDENDKLKLVLEYKKLKRKWSVLNYLLDKLRPEIINILEENGEIDNLHINKASTIKYDENKILNWVKDTYEDHIYKNCVKSAIDWEKLESLVKLGKINIIDLPSDCYREVTIIRIMEKKDEDKT